jgi:uncharacterized protein YlxP (DUF503 family)
MIIKLLTVDLHFPGRSSLKEKRFVLSSLKTKLGRQFNVAFAEVGYQEKWQRSVVAIVTVGSDGAVVESICSRMLRMLENDHRVVVLDYTQEIR